MLSSEAAKEKRKAPAPPPPRPLRPLQLRHCRCRCRQRLLCQPRPSLHPPHPPHQPLLLPRRLVGSQGTAGASAGRGSVNRREWP